jgi:TP901 family phage tail tape measure protein
MAKGGRIDYTIGFNIDNSGLQSIKTQLTNISQMTSRDFLNFNPNLKGLNQAESELQDIKNVVNQVRDAYDDAFDSTTGVTNINKLSTSLNNIGFDKIHSSLAKLGPEGVKSFNAIMNQTTKFNLKLKESNNFLTRMGETLTNTIKWGISSSLMNKFVGSVQQAYGYVQHLDTSLNDIRIVTGKSADEMDRFAEKANKAAQALGSSTTEYTEAALIYYQQGLSDEEAQARAETTLKAANVTGQTGKQVSEELTAVWNGYKVTAEETEKYVDKLAAVAATSASNLEELSIGMSKVASAANAMGVDVDQLNAQLSTIISVTRQAPETAGTALKTIYARMEDLKIDGETEDGVKLGEVSSTLDEVGVHIMDVNGDIRDLGEVIEEVGNKWYTWTEAQQSAIAQAIAGKRQYNNLLALFNNWEQYNKELDVSRNATGTLQQQQDTYMESTAAHIQQLKTEWEDFYDSLLDTDDINSILDVLTAMLDKVGKLLDSIGGGKAALTGLIGVLTRIPAINNVISSQIGSIITKNQNNKDNQEAWVNSLKAQNQALISGNATIEQRKQLLDQMQKNTSAMTDEQKQEGIQLVDNLRVLGEQKDVLDAELADVKKISEASLEARKNSINDKYALDTEEQNRYSENLSDQADFSSNDTIDTITQLFFDQEEAVDNVTNSLADYEKKLQEIYKYKKEMQETIAAAGEDSPEAEVLFEQFKNGLEGLQEDLIDIRSEVDDIFGVNHYKPYHLLQVGQVVTLIEISLKI